MKRLLAFVLVIGILLTGCSAKVDLQKLVDETAAVLLEHVTQPAPGRRDRTALSLALGGDASDFAGYDLTAPLENFEQTIFQGINGVIYALLALDSGGGDLLATEQAFCALAALQLSREGGSLFKM